VHMPNMDGLEATRRIRARFGSRDGPRIVAMTAGVLQEDREATIHAGMDDFISKPIRQEELAAALRRAAPRRGAGEPAIPDALARLRETLGDDDLAEVMEAFITETDALLPELHRAVAEGRTADARRQAHSLKGTSAALGEDTLSALTRRLEELAASGSLDGADDLLSAIETEYGRVRTELVPPEEDRS
jgi:DNA-binding NarL/FixJ family response regulator